MPKHDNDNDDDGTKWMPDDTDTKLWSAYMSVCTDRFEDDPPVDLGRKWFDEGKSIKEVVKRFRLHRAMRTNTPGPG